LIEITLSELELFNFPVEIVGIIALSVFLFTCWKCLRLGTKDRKIILLISLVFSLAFWSHFVQRVPVFYSYYYGKNEVFDVVEGVVDSLEYSHRDMFIKIGDVTVSQNPNETYCSDINFYEHGIKKGDWVRIVYQDKEDGRSDCIVRVDIKSPSKNKPN
jgi:hypothetical protein